MPKIVNREEFFSACRGAGYSQTITRQQLLEVCEKYALTFPQWFTNDPAFRVARGVYAVPSKIDSASTQPFVLEEPVAAKTSELEIAEAVSTATHSDEASLIPPRAVGYVPFGHFKDVRAIVKSNKFYPVYITGLSGNGKTLMVEQTCAQEKRECVRVNITIETDEDDLIGGFRLVNGSTVWQDGPVVTAMERGAVLLLDEVDLGSNKLMCLQPVLEGKPVFLKKIGKVVSPKPGFNIIATANTKGKGSDDGRFIGTNVLNEAFLERFSITLEQEYPSIKVEANILNNVLKVSGNEDPAFVDLLVSWSEVIRKSFTEGAVSEIISTRRLVHICEAYGIFNRNREKAITLCLNRFDVDTKTAFLDLYKKLDGSTSDATEPGAEKVEFSVSDEIAF